MKKYALSRMRFLPEDQPICKAGEKRNIAIRYDAKFFDSPEAAQAAGFVLTETARPRNVWNKASAASAIVLRLVERKSSGDVEEIGVVIEPWSVTGCYKPHASEASAA